MVFILAAGVTGSGDLNLKHLKLPITDKEVLKEYKAGEEIFIEGCLYTARDKVHSLVAKNEILWPFHIENNGIFYSGPTPKKEGFPFGSCGPTTSGRMDQYTPRLYNEGLAVTVGKGQRSREVVNSIKKNGGLYLVAYGGCGALYGSCVISVNTVWFRNLGPQAVYRIEVENFPVLVGIDAFGGNIFERKDSYNNKT